MSRRRVKRYYLSCRRQLPGDTPPYEVFCRTCRLADPRLPELWPDAPDLPKRDVRSVPHDDVRKETPL